MLKIGIKKNHSESKNKMTEKILTDKSNFHTIEAYKTIRTNIMFSLPKKNCGKVIALTSAFPGEGKTTTCINLAITFAQTDAKVIIVDCDLRKARVHRYLGEKRNEGVSNVLCGYAELKDVIKKNVRENLDVLTAGEIPPNPAELFETREFEQLIEQLSQEYDYIFIDTPPATIVTDALIIAKFCMGIIVVVRENLSTYDTLDKTIDYIKNTQTPIMGAIMLGSRDGVKAYGNRYKYKNNYKNNYKYKYYYGDASSDE